MKGSSRILVAAATAALLAPRPPRPRFYSHPHFADKAVTLTFADEVWTLGNPTFWKRLVDQCEPAPGGQILQGVEIIDLAYNVTERQRVFAKLADELGVVL